MGNRCDARKVLRVRHAMEHAELWINDVGEEPDHVGGARPRERSGRPFLHDILCWHGSRIVEPWTLQQYGASGEAAYEAVVKFIKLRYTLRN